ncbi:MAG: diaminopimelate decarboxylase [Deltaproteobacteria bacterium]|nr:MAG: diaminopimelate decarboxylase [Deltaproteobacteria bacterium]
MNHFQRKRGELCCEDVPLAELAAEVGTPAYVYSTATLRRHARVFKAALRGLDVLACFAVKSAPNLALLSLLAEEGFGFDIVSGGELYRALKAGGEADKIVFSGVGKREEEMEAALQARIHQFNCESEEELEQLSRVASRARKVAPVALRVNPEVDARTHPYVATALASSKFGVPAGRVRKAYRLAASLPGLKVVGLACHIGSQIDELGPFVEAAKKMRALFLQLRADGHDLRRLDMGGGLGVPYRERGRQPASPQRYGEALARALSGLEATVIFEPGRLLVANAGVLLSRVLLRKQGHAARKFVVVDAGMNDLLRPALYQAHHELEPVGRPRRGAEVVDVVGPVCESADVLAKRRRLPPLQAGDLVVLRTAGAYGMAMASQYNARPRPVEVLVDGRSWRVVRARESYADLVRGESV